MMSTQATVGQISRI